MTEDAKLTDFAGPGDESDGHETADQSAERPTDGSADDTGDEAGGATVEPARPTYAWGDDYACSDCGAAVERAWRGDDGLVCETCKKW